MRVLRWLCLGLLLISGVISYAQQIPPRPNPPRLVNDLGGVLLKDEADALERKLVAYNDSTSSQVAIVTIPTTGDYDISEYALKILRDWGIGTKEKNNGLLILVAVEDRRVRIETGYGMEGAVPDAIANRIIDQVIKPQFRDGHYYQGLDDAVDIIAKAAAGEYKGVPRKPKSIGGGGVLVIIIIIIILLAIANNRGGGGGTTISRRGWGGWIPMGGGGFGSSGGGWSGGGGGGGFGGFGGGSGGGGGASGSW